MDQQGRCSLSPAFDMSCSYNLQGDCTAFHQMTGKGKRDTFTLQEPRACAKCVVVKRAFAAAIVEEVRVAAAQWPVYAGQAGVGELRRDQMQGNLLLDLL